MPATLHILVMDLNVKGKTWVGSMYQKFEAMCQEVDDFVSQDTVKYVENQVQTVGDSVKRFCSDVVQDLLPGKHEDPVSPKESDIRSMINIEEKPLNTDVNLASVGQSPIHPLNEQFIHPPSADHIKEAESESSLGQLVNALKYKKEIAVEENDTTEELIEKMTDVFVKENNANEELIDKKSDVVEGNGTKEELSWHEELELVRSSIVVKENDANEEMVDKKSDINVEENDTKEEPDLICSENKDFSEASLLSESIDEKNDILTEVPAMKVVCHTQKDELSRNSFLYDVERVSDISSTFPPSKMDFSVVLADNKTAEMGLISCSHSSSVETCSMSELSPANVPHDEETICYNPVDAIGCVPDLSDALSPSQPFPISSCDNKVLDTSLVFSCRLSLESNDIDTSTTDDVASLSGSSRNRHEYCYECTQLEALMPSLEIGETDDCRVDISDPSMQTIELSEKGKLDESCVIVDSRSLYAFSCSAQKHRSYKKILQDAFASRKRVRKEYEQLAILYGDIDVELTQPQQLQNLLPSMPTLSLDSKKSSFNDLCDAEWELL